MCPTSDANAPKRPNPPPARPAAASPESSSAKPTTPKIVALKRATGPESGSIETKSSAVVTKSLVEEERAPRSVSASPKPGPRGLSLPPVEPPDPSIPHPIPPASEPMQYRAIGLVRGRYQPSEEQFTKGALFATDGTELDAVLLGRILSLMKNHVDLANDHLWVVYPRTREDSLHVQIVGIWEPETLQRATPDTTDEATDPEALAEAVSDDAALPETSTTEPIDAESIDAEPIEPEPVASGPIEPELEPPPSGELSEEFSIRGEVIFSDPEQEAATIKIRQAPRNAQDKRKAFKLDLKGNLGDRAIGRFWDLSVRREGSTLRIVAATSIALMPPQKRKGGKGGPGGKGGRPGGKPFGRRPGGDRPVAGRDGSEARPERPPGDRPEKPTRPQKKAETPA